MDRLQVIFEIKALSLPSRQYVVVGGAALAVRGFRNTDDIDLVVTPLLFEKLKSEGWVQKQRPNGRIGLKCGCVEAYLDVNTQSFVRDTDWLIAHSELVEGIHLADLNTILGWKRAYGRDKDARDIELLEKVIRQSTCAQFFAQGSLRSSSSGEND